MVRRMLMVALGLGLVTLVTSLHAQNAGQPSPQPISPEASKNKDKITLEEKKLGEKFNVFMQQLSQLKDRLEKGTEEDRNYAKVLDQGIQKSKNKSIDVQFQEMVEFIAKSKLNGPTELKEILNKSESLTKDLHDLLALIRQDKSLLELQNEQKLLKDAIDKLGKIIAIQQIIQAKTLDQALNPKNSDPKQLQGDQHDVKKKTDKVVKILDPDAKGSQDPKGSGNEGEIAKSNAKNSDAKGEGNKSDSKSDAKPGDGKGTQGKKGDGDDKGDQGKAKGGDGDERSRATAKRVASRARVKTAARATTTARRSPATAMPRAATVRRRTAKRARVRMLARAAIPRPATPRVTRRAATPRPAAIPRAVRPAAPRPAASPRAATRRVAIPRAARVHPRPAVIRKPAANPRVAPRATIPRAARCPR